MRGCRADVWESAGVGTLHADDVMPDDVIDHASLSGSAVRMSASASALPPPSEADEDIANLQDLALEGSTAASGACSLKLDILDVCCLHGLLCLCIFQMCTSRVVNLIMSPRSQLEALPHGKGHRPPLSCLPNRFEQLSMC